MNAKEALTLAKSSSIDEIAQIEEKIIEACKEGCTHIITEGLNEATIAWLKENGYEYKSLLSFGYKSGYYEITWK